MSILGYFLTQLQGCRWSESRFTGHQELILRCDFPLNLIKSETFWLMLVFLALLILEKNSHKPLPCHLGIAEL